MVIGANLLASRPLKPEGVAVFCGVAVDADRAASVAVDPETFPIVRSTGFERSRPASDEGACCGGALPVIGEAGFERPNRNRSSRISIAVKPRTQI